MHKECTEEMSGWNKAAEDQIKLSCQASQTIDDNRVLLPEEIGAPATVYGSGEGARTYKVTAPGTADAGCSCTHFMRGNTCKHIVKVSSQSFIDSG